MKEVGSCFSIALLLLFLSLNRFSCATETSDPQSSADKKHRVKDLNADQRAQPDPGKEGEVKKDKHEFVGSGEEQKVHEKSDPKGSVSEEKDKPQEESEVKGVGENGQGGEVSDSKTEPLKNSYVEVCDPMNQCNDEKNKLVACLRVPGEDSLSLSLLIQNKGSQSLTLNIIAPDFVSLGQSTVKILAKKDKKVSVYVKDGANEAVIQLKTETEEICTFRYGNTNSDAMKKTEVSLLTRYIISAHVSFIYLIIGAAVIIGAVWLCMKLRRMNQPKDDHEYQKMEMGLPVSIGGKKEADDTDVWDKSWGDGWDDEEAPVTPSKPASTPSSKGLAPRRFNKDGWKD
ncbi:uncharacterized protein LOC120256941 [Dioscorea cayenensis subsp. rotundata]|uniref:Uncharacterized protein LOC120256941 n=1 Tax=Dioscorea cayennensis subsp. rotundata TaxID=55577 RepID=A0AB40AZU5_DIOCR|nr:uncharacterized protein LOC120256941 [Dioscorea cayenensis subsp. rotundata]XP_039120533.1 uncharacterized protein LOC120256941 [Dioscorea cayenensis subsp. rotundata]